MPVTGSENGVRLTIINLEQIPVDAMADAVIHASLGELLTSLLQKQPIEEIKHQAPKTVKLPTCREVI